MGTVTDIRSARKSRLSPVLRGSAFGLLLMLIGSIPLIVFLANKVENTEQMSAASVGEAAEDADRVEADLLRDAKVAEASALDEEALERYARLLCRSGRYDKDVRRVIKKIQRTNYPWTSYEELAEIFIGSSCRERTVLRELIDDLYGEAISAVTSVPTPNSAELELHMLCPSSEQLEPLEAMYKMAAALELNPDKKYWGLKLADAAAAGGAHRCARQSARAYDIFKAFGEPRARTIADEFVLECTRRLEEGNDCIGHEPVRDFGTGLSIDASLVYLDEWRSRAGLPALSDDEIASFKKKRALIDREIAKMERQAEEDGLHE